MDREITVKERRKKLQKKLMYIGVAGIIVIILLIVLFRLMEPSLTRSSLDIREVDEGSIEITIAASGKLSPLVEEIIVSPINSRILETYKKPGDAVEEGEPLLRLDLASVETEYRQKLDEREIKNSQLIQLQVKSDNSISELEMQQQLKEMQLKQLNTDLKSEKYLDSIGASTMDKVRRAELAYDEAKLQHQQLKQKIENERRSVAAEINMQKLELSIFEKTLEESARLLKNAQILSPRKATLTFINNQIGVQITQGSQVATVSDLTRFKVDSEIADGHREKLTAGSKALVKTENTELTGTILDITPSITNGVIKFTVIPDDSENPDLRSGLKADVYVFHGRRQNVLRIPNGKWFNYGKGDYYLWVVTGDKAEKRKVSLGESSFEYVEVIRGLDKGEKVILSDMEKYKNRESLKIK